MSNLVPVYIDKDTGRFVTRPPVGQTTGSGATGYVHTQSTPAVIWSIPHGGNTKLLVHRIFDENYEEIIPDRFRIIDENNVEVRFAVAITGVVHLIYFTQV